MLLNNIILKDSIKRFINYVLNQKGTLKSYLFIDENIILDTEYDIGLIKENINRERMPIILGYRNINDINCYINLLDLKKLKKNLKNEFNKNRSNSLRNLLTFTEIKIKIDQFFKGHATSPRGQLDSLYYCFSSGFKVLYYKKIDADGFKTGFLDEGLKAWQNFKQRFNTYQKYLIITGFHNETNVIKGEIVQIDDFIIEKISNDLFYKQIELNEIDLILKKIEKINSILEDIKSIKDKKYE